MIRCIYKVEIDSTSGETCIRRYFRNKKLATQAAKQYDIVLKLCHKLTNNTIFVEIRKMGNQDKFWIKESEVEK